MPCTVWLCKALCACSKGPFKSRTPSVLSFLHPSGASEETGRLLCPFLSLPRFVSLSLPLSLPLTFLSLHLLPLPLFPAFLLSSSLQPLTPFPLSETHPMSVVCIPWMFLTRSGAPWTQPTKVPLMSYNNTRNPYLIYQGIFLLVKIGVVGEDAAITTVGEAVIPNAWSWRNGTHDFV